MPGQPREMITMAERRFPVRIRLGVPPAGFGQRHAEITAWLDQNCGADAWAITPSGVRGVLNDAVSIYFLDSSPAGAPDPGSRRMAACSVFATMSQRLELERHPIEHPDVGRNRIRIAPRLW